MLTKKEKEKRDEAYPSAHKYLISCTHCIKYLDKCHVESTRKKFHRLSISVRWINLKKESEQY